MSIGKGEKLRDDDEANFLEGKGVESLSMTHLSMVKIRPPSTFLVHSRLRRFSLFCQHVGHGIACQIKHIPNSSPSLQI